MANSQTASVPSAPAADLFRIDEVCDSHERALRGGQNPNLADALAGFHGPARLRLLDELLLVEIHHHWAGVGSTATVISVVKERYPELARELDGAAERVIPRLDHQSTIEARTCSYDVTPRPKTPSTKSKTLEIACPHCHDSFPIPADARSAEVKCRTCGSTFNLAEDPSATRDAATLKTVGHFNLLSRLGVGGCGTVWKAYDKKLDRTVAVKIPRAGQLERDDEERFLREARTAARLVHPNIVTVYEVGRDRDLIYFVSEFVRGVSLADWLTGKTLTFRQTAELIVKVAEALHYAHERGVIHRDIKPSNIILDADGEPHVTDFGLAKLEFGDATISADHQVMGTPAYMSPEQARGESYTADRRTDVYSLGVMLYQLLTGELPFRGNQEMLLHQITFDPPPSPRTLTKGVPRDLETICLKCLDKPVAGRYQSARTLADDLHRFLLGEPISARPVSAVVRGARWCRRQPGAATALALLIMIAVAGPAIAAYQFALRKQLDRYTTRLVGMQSAKAGAGTASTPGRSLGFTPPAIADGLTQSIRRHALATLDRAQREQISDMELVHLQLAAGMLEAREGGFEEAVDHFHQAEQRLRDLPKLDAGQPRRRAAMAFCAECLGLLYDALDNDELALEYQTKASDRWQQLVTDHPDEVTYRRGLASSLLRLSYRQSRDAALARDALDTLVKVKRLTDDLQTRWPDDPVALYELACELSDCPPILGGD